jgi:hypothetical protein
MERGKREKKRKEKEKKVQKSTCSEHLSEVLG